MAGYAYPYDITGLAASNVINSERYTIADYPNAFRCIIPRFAPFFSNDILIKHVATGRVLQEGLDYYLGYFYQDASTIARQQIFGGIMLMDTALTGQIEFTRYHTLGGQYLQRNKDITEFLAKTPMLDPRNVDFAEVMKWPRVVTPVEEPTTMPEALAVDPVLRALEALDNTLLRIGAEEQTKFQAIFNRMATITTRVRNFQFDGHYYGTDPHHVTYAQLNALGKDQTAKDALTAYGYTLAELSVLINQLGITPTNVAQYYQLIGGAFKGRISFTEGANCIIQNEAGSTIFNIATGQISILAESGARIIAESDKNDIGMSAQLQAANNTLSIHSTGTSTDKNAAIYNGYYLIHVGNIADYVKSSKTNATLDFTIEDTPYVNLSGLGTPSNPLAGIVTLPAASSTVAGLVQITDLINSQSTTVAASANALLLAAQLIATYVPTTRKINNKALTADITISKADITLGNVDNTADDDKPVSTAFTTALALKALDGHTHTLADLLNIPVASNTVSGITKLDSVVSTSVTTAATPAAGKVINDALLATTDLLDQKLPLAQLPIREYGRYTDTGKDSTGIMVSSIVGFLLTLKKFRITGDTWDIKTLSIDFADIRDDTLTSETFYLYVDTSNELMVIKTKSADTVDYSYIGYCVINTTTVTSVQLNPVYRIINNAELMRHVELTTAHGTTANQASRYGLGALENKALIHSVKQVSFADVFNSWYRFSHNTTNVYPAVPAETTTWAYDSATDSISSTTNSASYIGFISNEAIGDYEFDTAVSSTNTDDDSIGIVIGFYKHPTTGKEYTLSLLKVLSRDSAAMTWSIRLVYNMLQSDAWDIELTGSKSNYGWSTVGECRIRAVRTGDSYLLEMYGLPVFNGGALEWTRILDLNSDPRLAVFKGTTKFGYSCQSQANSTFRSIVRPDEDKRNYYASEWAVREMLQNIESNSTFIEGTVAHLAAIPIPAGFTLAKCTIHITPKTLSIPSGRLDFVECYVTAAGVAMIQAKNSSGAWTPGTATYYLFGAK